MKHIISTSRVIWNLIANLKATLRAKFNIKLATSKELIYYFRMDIKKLEQEMTSACKMEWPSIVFSLDHCDNLFDKLKLISASAFRAVEINTGNMALLKEIKTQFPQLKIGAGGIVHTQALEDCYLVNLDFASSPGFLPALVQTANIYSMNYLASASTISEAMQIYALGCTKLRPFPADLEFCKALYRYLPDLQLFPAFVAWEKAGDFLDIPSVQAVSILNPDHSLFEKIQASTKQLSDLKA